MFERGLRLVRAMYEIKAKEGLNDEEFEEMFYLFGEDLPIQLQVSVFLPCIKALASEEQLAQWLPMAQRYEMIGCYAQTELGHGSNVSGLQTEARYDPATDEIILNTPHPDATKWWIGQLGKCANHAVVFAQLLMPISGSDKYRSVGPHPFLVQIRRFEDHTVVPGIKVGDIGPKLGFAALDNGFIAFDNHRIPRSNMLSRYAKIDPQTKKYVPPSNPKLLYGSMLAVRAGIVASSTITLQAASTVAVRYSSIRRQFPDRGAAPGAKENQVLDYLSQQYRVLPPLAAAYATFFTGRWMSDMFKKLNTDFANGDFSLLPTMHATSSGLKSLITTLAAEGIESCRLSCGGHGYSLFSGLPLLYTSFVHVSTAEGENWLLNQQVVLQLMKLLRAANSSENPGAAFHAMDPANYLLQHPLKDIMRAKCEVKSEADWLEPRNYLHVLQHRSTKLLATIAFNLREAVTKHGASQADAWNQQLVQVHAAARAHCFAVIAQVFVEEVEKAQKSNEIGAPEYAILRKVAALFALYWIDKEHGQSFTEQYATTTQAALLKKALMSLLFEVRQQSVPLVDAFAIPDFSLNSALGRYDGNAYGTMLKWAQEKEPLNQIDVLPAFKQHIMPLVQKHRAKL